MHVGWNPDVDDDEDGNGDNEEYQKNIILLLPPNGKLFVIIYELGSFCYLTFLYRKMCVLQ